VLAAETRLIQELRVLASGTEGNPSARGDRIAEILKGSDLDAAKQAVNEWLQARTR